MISVTNPGFSGKENVLVWRRLLFSTMVLVIMSKANKYFKASENFKKVMNPHDFGITGQNVEKEDIEKLWASMLVKMIDCQKKEVLTYSNLCVTKKVRNWYLLRKVKIVFNRKLFLWSWPKRLWEYDRTETCTSCKGVDLFVKQLTQGQKELTPEWLISHDQRRNQKDFA